MDGPGMFPRDRKDVDEAYQYAAAREEEMNNLKKQAEDMGSLRLWWDSKKPDQKWFANPFKKSDPKKLQAEITKHRDFYLDMRIAMQQVRSGNREAQELIMELYDKLEEMHAEAESKKGSTDSKTLCRLYKEFVEKHQQLENKLKRGELAAVRQQLYSVTDECRTTLLEVRKLREEMQRDREDHRDLEERFERLMTVNEQLVNQQEDLMESNALFKRLIERVFADRETT